MQGVTYMRYTLTINLELPKTSFKVGDLRLSKESKGPS